MAFPHPKSLMALMFTWFCNLSQLFFARSFASVWRTRTYFSLSRCLITLRFVLLYCSAAMDLKLCQANQNFNLNFFLRLIRSEAVSFRFKLEIFSVSFSPFQPITAVWVVVFVAGPASVDRVDFRYFSMQNNFCSAFFSAEISWTQWISTCILIRGRPISTHFCMSPQHRDRESITGQSITLNEFR